MQEKPSISDAEWEVMKVLWAQSPATAEKVVKALESKTTWKPKTVMTLINRLASGTARAPPRSILARLAHNSGINVHLRPELVR